MSGIYIHVPFCVSRCGYCDFYKTTNFDEKGRYIDLLLKEIDLRYGYLNGASIGTIYFGGGTPSVLSLDQFESIFRHLGKFFQFDSDIEITVECNPDDISIEFLSGLRSLGVNRLSIGIQSFDDKVLRFMQRRHNGLQAENAVSLARLAGFENISIDLIYGLPDLTNEEWKRNLETAVALNVEHISAYHLTYEKDTAFDKLLKKGLIKEVEEDCSVEQFSLLLDSLNSSGFEQYEVSNFCQNEYYSKHNSSYWRGVHYLGLGPSAHSYNGFSRSWNVSNLGLYLSSLSDGLISLDTELLSDVDVYNETIMVGLRTKWGVDLVDIEKISSPTLLNYFKIQISKQVDLGNIVIVADRYILPSHKFMLSDKIISDLFYSL